MSSNVERPLFMICYHRSGSTYSMRLMNSCKNLAIYGEHDGVFNELKNLATKLYDRFGMIGAKSTGVELDTLHGDVQTEWIPYANPFTYGSFIDSTRKYVLDLFARDLPAHMRWGFKEIRYRTIPTIEFMHDLFPDAYFVFLQREKTDLLASNVRAPWVINPKLKDNGGSLTPKQLRQHVRKVMNTIQEFENTIEHCSKTLGPSRAKVVSYQNMSDKPEEMVRSIMDFIGEPQDTLDMDRLASAKQAEVGTEVKKDEKYQEMFQRDNLKKMATNFLRAQEKGIVDDWVQGGHSALAVTNNVRKNKVKNRAKSKAKSRAMAESE